MGRISDRLEQLGLSLPEPSAPPDVRLPFAPVHVVDGLAHVSGHGPVDGARVLAVGRVGDDVDVDAAYLAARDTALSVLASLQRALGDLDEVRSWVRALGFVRCAPGFTRTPEVINGFSDLVLSLWGDEDGAHARSAIGVAELPFGIPVEVEATIRLR